MNKVGCTILIWEGRNISNRRVLYRLVQVVMVIIVSEGMLKIIAHTFLSVKSILVWKCLKINFFNVNFAISSGKLYYTVCLALSWTGTALHLLCWSGSSRCRISARSWFSSKTETDHKNPDWKHSIFFLHWLNVYFLLVFHEKRPRGMRAFDLRRPAIELLSLRSSFFSFLLRVFYPSIIIIAGDRLTASQ